MKKLLFLLILMITMVSTKANDSIPQLTAKNVYEDMKAGFSKLVNTLEGPAKHTYQVYVNNYKIRGWTQIFILFISVFICGIITKFTWKRSVWKEGEGQNSYCWIFVVSIIIFIVSLGYVLFGLSNLLSMAINPEYYAIQEITEKFFK